MTNLFLSYRTDDSVHATMAISPPNWPNTSVADGWVHTELRIAFKGKIPVIPVLLEQTPLPMST